MKKFAPIALKVALSLTVLFCLIFFVLIFFTGRLFPAPGEDDSELMGSIIGFALVGIVGTLLPCIIMFIAFLTLDICLMAVKKKQGTLIATIVISCVFLPLYFIATSAYLIALEYAPWLLAILIPAYLAYIAVIVFSSIWLAICKKQSATPPIVAAKASSEVDDIPPLETDELEETPLLLEHPEIFMLPAKADEIEEISLEEDEFEDIPPEDAEP